MKARKGSEAGVSLIGVMVAIGILGILASGLATMFKNFSGVEGRTRLNIEEAAIKLTIIENASCSKTTQFCNPGTYVPFRRANGSFLFNNTGNGMGVGNNFFVRGKCNAAGTALVDIEVSRSKAFNSGFLKDPLTKKPASWSSLFGNGFLASPCRLIPGPTPAPTCTYYSYDYIQSKLAVNASASCNAARFQDACSCDPKKTFAGIDLYNCPDGLFTRARCMCCD